jgi:hypothetical protein
MCGGNEREGVLINEKPKQGIPERKKVGIHWSSGTHLRASRNTVCYLPLILFSVVPTRTPEDGP